MSKIDYDGMIEAIKAIPDSSTISPNMPVAVAIQEAEDLVHWCETDQEALTKSGLDWQLVTTLAARAGACRYAQSVWAKEFQTRQDAELQWKQRSPEAFDLRDELVHHFYHAFHNRPDLVAKVQAIADGGSADDMLQDLSDLAVLGEANLPLLTAVGVDTTLLERAKTLADELSEILALANGQRENHNEHKLIRDKAFIYMKQAVDEIRRHGQYVFWRDESRKKGYASRYFRIKPSKTDKPAPAAP